MKHNATYCTFFTLMNTIYIKFLSFIFVYTEKLGLRKDKAH